MDKVEQEAQEKAVALRAQVDELTVTDQASYDLAQSINEQALKSKKAFHGWFDPIDDTSKKAEDDQLAAAQLLQDLGMAEAAEEALVAEPVIEKVRVAAPGQAAGASVRTYYSAQVDDLKALVVAVATGLAPIQAIQADMTYLNGRARLEQGAFALPGVSVVKEVKQSRRL